MQKTLNIGALDGLSNNALMARFGDQIDTNNNGSSDASEWTVLDGDGNFTLADLAGGTPLTLVQEEVKGQSLALVSIASSDICMMLTMTRAMIYHCIWFCRRAAIFMAGKLISTGNGQLNVMDGYRNLNINNQLELT